MSRLPDRDHSQVLDEQNPWHRSGQVPPAWALTIERPLARFLWPRLLKNTPRRFQLILGPRRVGKTTTMYQTAGHLLDEGIDPLRIWWLRLDHPLLMNVELGTLAREVLNVAGATAEEPVFLFLDELTYAKDWDLWLKTFYDDSWPLTVVGSSSSTAALQQRRIESGIGRWEEQYLAPYLFGEFLDLNDNSIDVDIGKNLAETIGELDDSLPRALHLPEQRRRFILTGGFPELLNVAKDSTKDEASLLLDSQRTLRSDAVERAIYKDLPQAFGISNPMQMERLLYTIAGQIAGIFSPKKICQSLPGMSEATAERYASFLERAFLIFTLPNYSGNENARQRRGKKLYFVDGAVRNAALQRGLGPLNDAAEMGLLIENLAASHVHALGQLSQVRVYHWRHRNDEVDLIFDDLTHPIAFEIGSSPRHSRSGLQRLMEEHPHFNGNSYVVSPNSLFLHPSKSSDGIGSLPLDAFLLAVSAQAADALRKNLRA